MASTSTSSNDHLSFLAKVSEIYESALSPSTSNNTNDDIIDGYSQIQTATISHQPHHPPSSQFVNHRNTNNTIIMPRARVSVSPPSQPCHKDRGLIDHCGVPSADVLITAAREFSGAAISPTKRQKNWTSYVNKTKKKVPGRPTPSQQGLASHSQERLALPQKQQQSSKTSAVQSKSSSGSGYILVNGVPVQIPEGVEVCIPSPSAAGNNNSSSSYRHRSKQSASAMKMKSSSHRHRYSHNTNASVDCQSNSNPSSYQPRHQQHSDLNVVDSIDNPRQYQASSSFLTSTPHQDFLSHPSPHTQKCNTLFQRLGQSGLSEMATTTSLQLLLQHRRHNAVQRELAMQKKIMGMGVGVVGPNYRAYSNGLEYTDTDTDEQGQGSSPRQLLSAMPFSNNKQTSPTAVSTSVHHVSSNPQTTTMMMMQRRHSKAATPSPTPQDPLQAFARFDSAGSSNTVSTQESTLPLYCTTSSSQPLVLFRPCDKRKLNKLYYYIGNHILEAVPYSTLYNSSIDESTWVARERNIQAYRKSVTQGLHFVCRYCRSNNNAHVHIQSAVFSTKTVGGIYRRIPQFITKHIKSGACTSIPEDVRNRILDMKKTRAEVGNGEFEVCLRSNGYRDTLGDVEHCVELVEKEEWVR